MTPPYDWKWKRTIEPLMKMKEESEKESEKVGLNLNIQKTTWSHHFMANRWGNNGNSDRIYFPLWRGGSKIITDGDCSHEIKRHLLLGIKAMTKLDSILKSRGITLPTKVRLVKAMVFSVVMYGCKRKLKNWCFWTVLLKKTLESPLDCKEIQPVHPKGNQSLIFIGRTDVEAGTPILWPPDVKNWLIGKDPDAGKEWRQEEKGMTEDEMVGWHHRLEGHEFEKAPGVGNGQRSLACCSPWVSKSWTWLNV